MAQPPTSVVTVNYCKQYSGPASSQAGHAGVAVAPASSLRPTVKHDYLRTALVTHHMCERKTRLSRMPVIAFMSGGHRAPAAGSVIDEISTFDRVAQSTSLYKVSVSLIMSSQLPSPAGPGGLARLDF
jgi:hypothetical protein